MLDLPDAFIGSAPEPPTAEPAHHPIGPSSFDRAALCPGSVALNAQLPDEPEDPQGPAANGTRAHELLEHCINRQEDDASEYTGYSLSPLSPRHPNAPPVFTASDTNGVNVALRHIKSLMVPGALIYTERKLDLSIAKPGLFGRGDIGILWVNERHFHCVDYKHGSGVRVEVTGSRQCKGYDLGWLRFLLKEHPIQTVTNWIIQPRLQPPHEDGQVRSETMHVLDVLDWVPELKAIIKRTEDPNAPRIPGEKQCQFCKGAKQLACREFLGARNAARVSPFGEVTAP